MERDYKVNKIIFSDDTTMTTAASGTGGARWRGNGDTLPTTDLQEGDLFMYCVEGGGLNIYVEGDWLRFDAEAVP